MIVSPPRAGELELVLRRGEIEWGRGVTRGGQLRFDSLAPGGYLLRAEDTGGLLAEPAPDEEWSGDEDGPPWRWVEVPEPGATAELELRLVRAATLAGAVRDAVGAPVAGAVVMVQDSRRLGRTRRVATDELGSFLVEALPPSRYVVAVEARAPGAAEPLVALPIEAALDAGGSAWVELCVETGARTVRGRVIDRRLEAVEGLRILCSVPGPDAGREVAGRPPAGRIAARARTGADGAFELEGLPAAGLRVAVDARELELRADGERRRLRRAFLPLHVDTAAGSVDLGVLFVERPPSR